MTKTKPNGYVIYIGKSLADNTTNIVLIATVSKSRNIKTGNMLQTYILVDGVDPREASKTGQDYAVCGDCVHRGIPTTDPNRSWAEERSCYVNLGQGVLIVYNNYMAGKYPVISGHDAIAELGVGRLVRGGTYGDPSLVPSYIWDSLISLCDGYTMYSHQANMPSADYRPDIMMRSADTRQEAIDAWNNGERTFRVTNTYDDIVQGKEIRCPASKEMGQRTTCASCKLCGGSSVKAKSIVIMAHGMGKKHYASA